ncbi:MAG: hypothetical protein JWL81_2107 [Verrucomicrobiales bacterium]|nr:hypothetical protein [Verrucomicrobiales bacterium]
MKSIRLLGALAVPVLFGLGYAPLHRGWVVQAFGCGCQRGFNANSFSFALHAGAAVAAEVWLQAEMEGRPWRSRMNFMSLGTIFVVVASLYFWAETRVV